jgi:hypothetical protein
MWLDNNNQQNHLEGLKGSHFNTRRVNVKVVDVAIDLKGIWCVDPVHPM